MMEGCVWVETLKFMFFGEGAGGEEKHAVLLLNFVKHLSNWPVIGSAGCRVTTVKQSDINMLRLGPASRG